MPWLPLPSQLFPSSLSLSPSMDAAGTSQARARADPARAAAQRGWCSGTAGATRRRLSLALLVSRGDAPAVAAAAALSVSPDSDVAVGVGAPNVHLDLRSVVVAVQLHKGFGSNTCLLLHCMSSLCQSLRNMLQASCGCATTGKAGDQCPLVDLCLSRRNMRSWSHGSEILKHIRLYRQQIARRTYSYD